MVLPSKIAGPDRRDWIRNGETHVSAKTIPWAIDDSFERRHTDYIDLYPIHRPDREVPMLGTWEYEAARERDTVPNVAQKHGVTPVAMALAFVQSRIFTVSTIIGATTVAQLNDMAAAFALTPAPEVIADIAAVHTRVPNPTALSAATSRPG